MERQVQIMEAAIQQYLIFNKKTSNKFRLKSNNLQSELI